MKDKVKRRRILHQRKMNDLLGKYNQNGKENSNNLALEKERQKIAIQQNDYDQIVVEKIKLKLIKKKSKELNQQLLLERTQSNLSTLQFLNKYHDAKNKRKLVIKEQKQKISHLKSLYREKYETMSFKIKRWFFGMGKEFMRIRWANKKILINNLIIVISISVFFATLYFVIDLLFGLI